MSSWFSVPSIGRFLVWASPATTNTNLTCLPGSASLIASNYGSGGRQSFRWLSYNACLLSVDHISNKQEAAMSNRVHLLGVNNDSLILWWSSNCFHEHSASQASRGCITPATSSNVRCHFGDVKVYPSLKTFIIKHHFFPLD